MNKSRIQASSEFLTTYGFGILIIALMLIGFYILTSSTQTSVPNTCTFSYGIYCNDLVLASNSVGSHAVFLFTNTQQYSLVNPQMSINSSNTGAATGTCEPKYVPAGSAIICNVTINGNEINAGSQVNGQIKLTGITCPSGNANLCTGSQSQTFIGTFNTHASALTTSNPVSITLSAQNYTQFADGTYDQLTARVMLLGYPLTGGSINFTSNQTFATPSPTIAVSNSNGDSYSFVRSTNSTGSVKITASFAGHSASVIIGFARPVYVTFATKGASGALGTILSVDGNSISQSQLPDRFAFGQGTYHTYSFTTLLSGASGTRYSFASISGCSFNSASQTFYVSSSCTATASYTTQYYLTMSASPSSGGSVSPSPPGIWENAGSQVTISESPSAGYAFNGWSGSGAGSYSGATQSPSIILNNPISETAAFTSTSTSTSTSTTLSTTSTSISTTSTTSSSTSTSTSTSTTSTSTSTSTTSTSTSSSISTLTTTVNYYSLSLVTNSGQGGNTCGYGILNSSSPYINNTYSTSNDNTTSTETLYYLHGTIINLIVGCGPCPVAFQSPYLNGPTNYGNYNSSLTSCSNNICFNVTLESNFQSELTGSCS